MGFWSFLGTDLFGRRKSRAPEDPFQGKDLSFGILGKQGRVLVVTGPTLRLGSLGHWVTGSRGRRSFTKPAFVRAKRPRIRGRKPWEVPDKSVKVISGHPRKVFVVGKKIIDQVTKLRDDDNNEQVIRTHVKVKNEYERKQECFVDG